MFVLNKHVDVDTYYVSVPITCRLVKAYGVVDTQAVDTAAKTATFSDGTNTIGVITTGGTDAEGTETAIVLDSTTKGAVELSPGTPLRIVVAGAGTGELELSMLFDIYHADN